jgi:hypothetical protein
MIKSHDIIAEFASGEKPPVRPGGSGEMREAPLVHKAPEPYNPDPGAVVGNRIGEFLVQIGVMFPFQVDDVVRLQEAGDKRKFGEIAIALGYLVDDQPIRQFLEYQAKLQKE